MGTITDKLNKLAETKSAIKTAIVNKGVTISDTDTFASYADKINSISSGGGGGYEFDFTVLGYNQEECKDANTIANVAITLGDFTQSQITEAIAYGKELYDSNYSVTDSNVDKDKLLFYPKLELPNSYSDSKVLYIPNVEYSSTGSYTTNKAYSNNLLYKIGNINAVFTSSHYSQVFFSDCSSLREVGDINITGKAINYNDFFKNCCVLRKIGNLNTTGSTNFGNMFYKCLLLTTIPQLDTSSGTNFSGMFNGCTSLTSIPQLDTSSCTKFNNMFQNCTSLTSIPQMDTSKGTSFDDMLSNCTFDVDGLDFSGAKGQYSHQKPFDNYKGKRVSNIKTTKYSSEFFNDNANLESATNIDASASTDHSFNNMFNYCSKLKEVSFATSTSNITNFNYMFGECSSLNTVQQIDTSKGTSFSGMFNGCRSLTSIPQLDTSSGTSFESMFSNCKSLITAQQLDTSNGTNFNYMFGECSSLNTVQQIDTSKGTSFSGMFNDCSNLKRIEGISFKSLNKTVSGNYLTGYNYMNYLRYALIKDIGTCTGMTSISFMYQSVWGKEDETSPDARQSLVDSLLTYSFDRATAGYSTCTISLNAATKAILTSDEIAQITIKGYTIA